MAFRYLIIDKDTRVIVGETLDPNITMAEDIELWGYNGGVIDYSTPKKIKNNNVIEPATDFEQQVTGVGPYGESGRLEFPNRAAKLYRIAADEIERQAEINLTFGFNADVSRALTLRAEADRLTYLPIEQ